jgi:hypothetical protein
VRSDTAMSRLMFFEAIDGKRVTILEGKALLFL